MKSYLITDPIYYGNTPQKIQISLEKAINSNNIDFILFRDKSSNSIKEIAKTVKEIANSHKIPILLSGNILLAKELSFNGVHLTSTQFDEIEKAKKELNIVGISTHSLKEALLAQEKGVDYITYSPIFETPNKAKAKGLADLNQILDRIDIKCFALGGIITQSHIDAISSTKAYGFASIRYFIH